MASFDFGLSSLKEATEEWRNLEVVQRKVLKMIEELRPKTQESVINWDYSTFLDVCLFVFLFINF